MGLYIITKSIAINTSHNNLHRGFALKNILLELYQIVGNGGRSVCLCFYVLPLFSV
jgi:hypothetical protein